MFVITLRNLLPCNLNISRNTGSLAESCKGRQILNLSDDGTGRVASATI